MEEIQVREFLSKLDTDKSMDTDGRDLRVLRELVSVTARTVLIIFARSWSPGEMSKDWKKANVLPVFKKDKNKDLQGATGYTASP